MRATSIVSRFFWHKQWSLYFDVLNDEEAGELIKAIFMFTRGEDPEIKSDRVRYGYAVITDKIEKANQGYIEHLKQEATYGNEE